MALILAEATGASPAPAATTTGTEQPAPGEHAPFPPFDGSKFPSQLLWLAITFAALYWLLARVAIPRIGGILAGRAGRIASDLETAEKARVASDAAIAAYEKSLAAARARAGVIADGARGEAKAAADAERSVIEADLGRRLADAETRIAEIKSRALAEVGSIASDAASAIVKALVDADVGKADADAAVSTAMGK